MNTTNTAVAIQTIRNQFSTLSETNFFLWQEQFVESQEANGVHPNDICEMLAEISYLCGLIYNK